MDAASVAMWICCGDWRRAPTAGLSRCRAGSINGLKTPPALSWRLLAVTGNR